MFIKKNFPAFIWTLIVLVLCSMPGKAIPKFSWTEILSFDKLIHAFMFFVLQTLYVHGFKTQNSFYFLKKHHLIIPLVVSIAYGVSLELMQYYIFIERSGDMGDVIANSTGTVTATFFYKKIQIRLEKIYSKLWV